MRKALILPLREVRTICCHAALSVQHCGYRAQGIKELSAEELDLICAQHQQKPQGNNEDDVKVQLGIC